MPMPGGSAEAAGGRGRDVDFAMRSPPPQFSIAMLIAPMAMDDYNNTEYDELSRAYHPSETKQSFLNCNLCYEAVTIHVRSGVMYSFGQKDQF